ncbi:MAG: MBL fold metallo-hydrolase [Syntrophomonadaceae bacterium]|jgi:glyoxylase-like metal-dependent hydrolase (beta-lactamase superfamily II)
MIKQVLPDIYKIEIPLPKNPLKATNSYFIRGNERNLLVDTGFNCEESRQAMVNALRELEASMENTDLFITHLHSDHAGLLSFLATPQTTVWISEPDGYVVGGGQKTSHWNLFKAFLVNSGLIADGIENTIERHPGYRYAPEMFDDFTFVGDGYSIKVGRYNFQCIATKGHTPGHICLYDKDKKLLLSGDHILGKITPNITLWQLGEDVLGDYLNSLDRIAALDVELVLPGHRYIIENCQGRINELKNHHKARLQNVQDILGDRSMSSVEVAAQMKWDLSFKDWRDFPWGQKLFAAGEAMSHLYHLFQKGILQISCDNDIFYFKKR